jgi:hypothetical protein
MTVCAICFSFFLMQLECVKSDKLHSWEALTPKVNQTMEGVSYIDMVYLRFNLIERYS